MRSFGSSGASLTSSSGPAQDRTLGSALKARGGIVRSSPNAPSDKPLQGTNRGTNGLPVRTITLYEDAQSLASASGKPCRDPVEWLSSEQQGKLPSRRSIRFDPSRPASTKPPTTSEPSPSPQASGSTTGTTTMLCKLRRGPDVFWIQHSTQIVHLPDVDPAPNLGGPSLVDRRPSPRPAAGRQQVDRRRGGTQRRPPGEGAGKVGVGVPAPPCAPHPYDGTMHSADEGGEGVLSFISRVFGVVHTSDSNSDDDQAA
ncbi:unnamed protein product [Vitrella brassicaformis CCMP3155]|uniref:Uncharacterized protein n=1 Tax=Vitrella brassicaformis (strain CCMP3155) TaxID=1169540 RepID=A0A0G4EHK4_VITBC|nr:unnamed protein product [Vitrella brassicaformis CCMP3155]|eukprot:CEL95500.1 unnamed protein product [Vitrella brassicaformis CCMP3155]